MSSLEIAGLTGKRHVNVARNIRVMLKALEESGRGLSLSFGGKLRPGGLNLYGAKGAPTAWGLIRRFFPLRGDFEVRTCALSGTVMQKARDMGVPP